MGGDPLLLLQVMELNSCSPALTSALFYWKHPPFTFSHRMWKLGCLSSPLFNSRLSPSLAPAAVQDWPFTLVMLRPSFSFGPACREEMVGWTLSHPHTDLWGTMVSGSFFGFRVVRELPPDEQTVYTLLTQTHSPLTIHTSYPVPTQPCLQLFSHINTNIDNGLCLSWPLQSLLWLYQGSPHPSIL